MTPSKSSGEKIINIKNDIYLYNNMSLSRRELELKFYKINYFFNIEHYDKSRENVTKIFNDTLFDFFKHHYSERTKFQYDDDNYYQICHLRIKDNYIFARFYKLKDIQDKEWEHDGDDYIEKPQQKQELIDNYIYIDMVTHHAVVETQPIYSSGKVVKVIERWYGKHRKYNQTLNFRNLKNKKDFLPLLKEAHKIISAKFTLYPSNIDIDKLTKGLDDAIHRLKLSKLKQEMKSKQGMNFQVDEPDLFNSALYHSLRGNGDSPQIDIEDERGNVKKISKKIKDIMRIIESVEKPDDLIKFLKEQLEDVKRELDEY